MKRLAIIVILAAIAIFGAIAYADAGNTVLISATVNSKIVVTCPDPSFTVPAVDPDLVAPASFDSTVTVNSNIDYLLSVAETGDDTVVTTGYFTAAPAINGATVRPKANNPTNPATYAQTFGFDPSGAGTWLDAGTYSATYTYTAVAAP